MSGRSQEEAKAAKEKRGNGFTTDLRSRRRHEFGAQRETIALRYVVADSTDYEDKELLTAEYADDAE